MYSSEGAVQVTPDHTGLPLSFTQPVLAAQAMLIAITTVGVVTCVCLFGVPPALCN